MDYCIEKFTPFRYEKYNIDLIGLDKLLGKQMHYASCGKAALYHCLLSLNLSSGDKLLVPNYICSSVLVPIFKLGLVPVYYDINENDLNADINSIITEARKDSSIRAVLVASMYGNPADLGLIEDFCKNKGKYTINGYPLLDASSDTPIAQSVERRIIEIPLEDDVNKLNYIIESVQSFLTFNIQS